MEGKYYPHVQQFLRSLDSQVRAQVPKYYMSSTSNPLSPASGPIVLTGDKIAVRQVRALIQQHIDSLELSQADVAIPFLNHRFLVGKDGSELDAFVSKTGCSIVIPTPDKMAGKLFIIGPVDSISAGIKYAKEKASKFFPHSLNLLKAYPNNEPHIWNILRYFEEVDTINALKSEFNVEIDVPTGKVGNGIPVVFIGDNKDNVDLASKKFVKAVNESTPYRFKEIEVDPIHQRQLLGNGGRQIKPITDSTGVQFVFDRDDSTAVLVYGKELVDDEEAAVAAALAEAEKQLNELIAALPAIHSQTFTVPTE